MFHARMWGWKRLAANLLLLPVLGGWSIGTAQAQYRSAGFPQSASGAMPATRSGGSAPATTSGDPQAILRDGRKALAAGQFDRAQDLAQLAQRSNPSGKWRLFDDTPRSLLQDIQDAVAKKHKAQSEQLIHDARALVSRKTSSELEKASNLDRAYQMAEQAYQLHGPYSAWDLGDRADKLMKQIKSARGKLNVPATAVASNNMPNTASSATSGQYNSAFQTEFQPNGAPANRQAMGGAGQSSYGSAFQPDFQPQGGSPNHLTQASGTTGYNSTLGGGFQTGVGSAPQGSMPPSRQSDYGSALQPSAAVANRVNTPANDARKATVAQMMNEARGLADQNDFAAARAKLAQADRVGAIFGSDEYNPGNAIQELNARGSRAIDTLVAECGRQMGKKDYEKAEAAIDEASRIATSLGLYARGVDEMRTQLKWKTGHSGSTGVVAAGNAAMQPASPVDAIPAKAIDSGKPVVPAGGNIDARQLLAQAHIEFRNNSLDTATRLAEQAYNLGGQHDKEQATALLNSIDAEKYAQKQLSATRSFEAAQAAMKNRDYSHALGVLVLIDTKLLPEKLHSQHEALVKECRESLAKSATGGMTEVATTGGTQQSPGMGTSASDSQPGTIPGVTSPGSAHPTQEPRQANPDNLATQQDALRRVQVQKLRSEGLKVQSDAQAAFGRGETDLAIQMLLDYANRVRTSGMQPSSIAMLLRPIDSRLELFRVMKGQADAVTRLNKENRASRDLIAERSLADDQRRAEVQARVRKYHELVKAKKYEEAEKEALVAKQLDPDDPALTALAHIAKITGRQQKLEQQKENNEKFNLKAWNEAEAKGAYVSVENPVDVNLDAFNRARRRGNLDDAYLKTRTKAEFEIEMKLDKPIPIEINNTPLEAVIDHLRTITELPISIDTAAIEAEGINLSKPITEKLSPVATKHILTIILEKAGLSYIVENDVVKVTTTRKAKGRLFTKVFSVADLVTPIPNFALPDFANMEKMLAANPFNTGRVQLQGMSGTTPFMPANSLGGGNATGQALPGSLAEKPGIAGGLNVGASGQLTSNPLNESAHLAGERNTKHEQLIKLITGMVRPYSWDGMGGPGRIEYFDIGSALVVNQVADVIQEVADLLEALRRLQDLAVAVEIRIISLSESWYERLGVDFAMNILTHNASLEPSLTQFDPNTFTNGVFSPIPYLNSFHPNGGVVGITPAGNLTPDLGVPIRPNTFNMAIPEFGGFQNTPGANGGIAFGLAFLNDIQVSLFMEAAQGDRRISVMQAPKITLFNGQTATLNASDQLFFVTNISVVSVNGQLVFVPNNTPLPIGVSITVQAVVSADRRFVRLNLPITLTSRESTNVPLFPVTTFITPVFEGGSQGVPIPFTQFLQQPAFTTLTVNTTVVCPDGGTVLMGGLKTAREGRNEFGPPFLSKIPYLNRLFKNVGIGRDTEHIMIMVTPRIIINSEEEIFQTEGARGGTR